MTDDNPEESTDGTVSRRHVLQGSGALTAFAMAGVAPVAALASTNQQEGDLAALLADLPKNWGRWGDDDELGAFNFLDGEQAFRGLTAAMKGGRAKLEVHTLQISMTGEVDEDPIFPTRVVARRDNTQDELSYDQGEAQPLAGGLKFSDDKFINTLFPQGSTHVDAPGHAWYGERIYNGFDALTTAETKTFDDALESCADGQVDETRGLGKADISHVADHGIVGRGVLIDVGREKGDSNGRLPPNACVTLDDLRETADAQGTSLEKRDIPLLRTGSAARARDQDPVHEWEPLTEPGLCFSEELVRWVHEMEFPMIGGDTLSVEKNIQTIDGERYFVPLHGAFHRNLGMPFAEVLWLEDLAADAARDGVYEGLFAGAPVNIERATGAIINPVVVKASRPERGNRS